MVTLEECLRLCTGSFVLDGLTKRKPQWPSLLYEDAGWSVAKALKLLYVAISDGKKRF